MLAARWIDRLERHTREDLAYAREIAELSPKAFWKLALMGPVVSHIGSVPIELHHLARLGALVAEDCGPCVQTQVNEAITAGVTPAMLRTALRGPRSLPPLERDAYDLGRGVASSASLEANARDRVSAALGRRGLVDLTVAAAAVRIFPALKRGLGHALSCSAVQIEAR